jgi:hypothetical protein
MGNSEREPRQGGSAEGGSGNLGGKEQTGGSKAAGQPAGQSKSGIIYDSKSDKKSGEKKIN